MKYESRAALLRAAADSIEMQEKDGCHPMCKNHRGEIFSLLTCAHFSPHYFEFEFPLGVVEGKPVFEGDELWNVKNNFKFIVRSININHLGEEDFLTDGKIGGWLSVCSWIQPKPKTVMVELDVEEVEYLASLRNEDVISMVRSIAIRAKKSLEAL